MAGNREDSQHGGVGQEKQHDADVQHKGLPQPDVQPPGGQRHHSQDQADLEQHRMHGPRGQRATETQAALGTVKHRVEHHVPGHGDQRNHQRQQPHVGQRVAEQPGAQRRAEGNRQHLETEGVKKTFLDGLLEAGVHDGVRD